MICQNVLGLLLDPQTHAGLSSYPLLSFLSTVSEEWSSGALPYGVEQSPPSLLPKK